MQLVGSQQPHHYHKCIAAKLVATRSEFTCTNGQILSIMYIHVHVATNSVSFLRNGQLSTKQFCSVKKSGQVQFCTVSSRFYPETDRLQVVYSNPALTCTCIPRYGKVQHFANSIKIEIQYLQCPSYKFAKYFHLHVQL